MQQAPSVPASSSNKQTTAVRFPGSANWTSIRQAVNSVPSFSIQNVLTYFIERKAEDKESNNDFKNIANCAFALPLPVHYRLPNYHGCCTSEISSIFISLLVRVIATVSMLFLLTLFGWFVARYIS